MTNHRHGPSLLQARDSHSSHSDSISSSPSSISGPHARSALAAARAHLHAHRHLHHPPAHTHLGPQAQDSAPAQESSHDADSDDQNISAAPTVAAPNPTPAPAPASVSSIPISDLDETASSDSPSLDARSVPAAAVDAAIDARADHLASYVTQVVQTISLIQIVDNSGLPISTRTQYANPNTVVMDPSTGETISESAPAFTMAVNPGELLPGLGGSSSPSSTPSTTTSTHHTTSTSSDSTSSDSTSSDSTSSDSTSSDSSSSAPIPSPSSVSAGFPTLGDSSNGTTWGNVTVLGSPSNSTLQALASTQSSNISTTLSSYRLYSSSSSSSISSSSSSSSSLFIATPTYNSPFPTVDSSSETSTSTASGGDPLTPQQKQIVGGVVGSIAGVAFLALLVMLALRYKKKRAGEALPSNTETRGFAALRASGSDATNSMAERNGAASSVTAAFAALTNKRQSRDNPSNNLEVPPSNERGFYRVSGRKLPSVLYGGGDGYTDPRESTLSQCSQSSEPFNPGSQPFALGTPMRPVSGVPIMRSGPARMPVTESNPFADPAPSPPLPNYESPPRRPGSSGSPRASGSRFQESI